jgi:hypothetical protein
VFALLVISVSACDEKGSGSSAAVDAASSASASATVIASSPPPAPKPPVITLDDASFVATGDKVDMSAADARGRIVAMLGNKPLVSGQTLELDALRDTTMPRLMVAIGALSDAKVKSLVVKTAQRDHTIGTLNVALDHGIVAPCAAVAMVTKDNAIDVWPQSGAVAQRFSHGFAGPDITLGSAALAKLANACDTSYDFVAGDDTIKWGVVFDLALAASQTPGFKATSTIILTKTPVPGRKVTE